MSEQKMYIEQIHNAIETISIEDISTQYLLQSSAWARVKQAFGWTPFAFRQHCFPHLNSDILVLVRKIRIFGKLAYIPDGILFTSLKKDTVDIEDESAMDKLKSHLSDAYMLIAGIQLLMQKQDSTIFCVRWDCPWICQKDLKLSIADYHPLQSLLSSHQEFNKKESFAKVNIQKTVQPPATVMLDLRKSEDELLAEMKQKTRYNIRLAEKKGVQVSTNVSLNEFYELYETTSHRNHIAIHSKAYYQKVIEEINASKESAAFIYGAYFEEKLIASIIVIYTVHDKAEKTALYLYGASSDEYRNLMPAYGLQWQAIVDAKTAGCTSYDMFGIPLTDYDQHRMHGIYKFKIGFGGKIRFRPACFEIFTNIGTYKIRRKYQHLMFLLVEKLRLWYHYKYKK